MALVLSHTPALLTRKLIVTEVVVVVVAEVVLIVVGWALSSHHVAAAAPGTGGIVAVMPPLVVTKVVHTAAHSIEISSLSSVMSSFDSGSVYGLWYSASYFLSELLDVFMPMPL